MIYEKMVSSWDNLEIADYLDLHKRSSLAGQKTMSRKDRYIWKSGAVFSTRDTRGTMKILRKQHFYALENSLLIRVLLKSLTIFIPSGTEGHRRDIHHYVPKRTFFTAGHFIYASIGGV